MKRDAQRRCCRLVAAVATAVGLVRVVSGGVELHLPETIPAAVGVECNVYFANITDAIVPASYGWRVKCDVGLQEERRWTFRPKAGDAKTSHRLVVEMWNDAVGRVAAATSTVAVVAAPENRKRPISLALIGDSLVNCRYPNYLYKLMSENGFNYTPVGTRSHDNAQDKSIVQVAKHDGFGGYGWYSFLTTYAFTVAELDNLQSDAEKSHLRRLGSEIKSGDEWRKDLLRSPLLVWKDGAVRVDVKHWFGRINGGRAPDFILIALGANDVFRKDESSIRAGLKNDVFPYAKRLVDALRKDAPKSVIGIATALPGASQDAFGRDYGCQQTEWTYRRNVLAYNRALQRFVAKYGDPNLSLIPTCQAIDTRNGYLMSEKRVNARSPLTVRSADNALHPDISGGMQIADAIYAWLLSRMN